MPEPLVLDGWKDIADLDLTAFTAEAVAAVAPLAEPEVEAVQTTEPEAAVEAVEVVEAEAAVETVEPEAAVERVNPWSNADGAWVTGVAAGSAEEAGSSAVPIEAGVPDRGCGHSTADVPGSCRRPPAPLSIGTRSWQPSRRPPQPSSRPVPLPSPLPSWEVRPRSPVPSRSRPPASTRSPSATAWRGCSRATPGSPAMVSRARRRSWSRVSCPSPASPASKRHLGRSPRVQAVGVASGPDGEFVFHVTHRPDVSFRDVIPSMPRVPPPASVALPRVS